MQFGGEISAATLATCLFQWALASCVNFSLIAPECSCLAGMCIRVGNSDHPTGLCINRQRDAESYLQNCLHIRANNGCSHNDFRRVCLELDNIFKSRDRRDCDDSSCCQNPGLALLALRPSCAEYTLRPTCQWNAREK